MTDEVYGPVAFIQVGDEMRRHVAIVDIRNNHSYLGQQYDQ